MFGRRKASTTDAAYIGSTLMTMSQAVFAAAEYGDKPEGSWRQLTNLLYGVMYRRGWYPDASDFEIRSIVDLVQMQTQNPYGEMPLGSTWDFYGGVPLEQERLEVVRGALLDLSGLGQDVAIPTFMNELAPIMGKSDGSLLSFAQALPLVHAAFALVTVFGDTSTSLGRERQKRRELASSLEAQFICGWAKAEMITVASGRDTGDKHSDAYQPWW
jgi:hypothetical protein